jgi:hypothetical protein
MRDEKVELPKSFNDLQSDIFRDLNIGFGFSSLKGSNSLAQGEALGNDYTKQQALKGRNSPHRRRIVAPFQG